MKTLISSIALCVVFAGCGDDVESGCPATTPTDGTSCAPPGVSCYYDMSTDELTSSEDPCTTLQEDCTGGSDESTGTWAHYDRVCTDAGP
jgi:hypothetical protein